MRVITVARKPLGESTVAANVLRQGTGALNIDASRIGTTVETWPKSRAYGSSSPVAFTHTSKPVAAQATGGPPNGRWPANLILVHREGCRETGETVMQRTVVHGLIDPNSDNTVYAKGLGRAITGTSTEAIPVWDCEPDCPVRALDRQSGVQTSGVAVQRHGGGQVIFGGIASGTNTVGAREDAGFGARSVASRYFKQVGGTRKP